MDKRQSRNKKGKFVKHEVLLQRNKMVDHRQRKAFSVSDSDKTESESMAGESVLHDHSYITNGVPVNLLEGRRIVELDTLAQGLVCKSCSNLMDLRKCVKVTTFGLGNILHLLTIYLFYIRNIFQLSSDVS